MSAERKLDLALFIHPTGHHQAAWRHPDSQANAGIDFNFYRDLTLLAERECFDAIFLADGQNVRNGPTEVVSRTAQYSANFEPLTLLSALSSVTTQIGLVATASTSWNYPYQIARKFASLDHLSAGRAGWNMVTSGMPGEPANFGADGVYEHDDRYRRADEVVEVVKGLWDSWEDDAFLYDKAGEHGGLFFDPEKLHTLGHDGEYVRVKGPLNVPRSPQGYPLLVQAGQSEAGRTFSAKHAEMMFTTSQSLGGSIEVYREMKERVAANGRNPDHFKVMPGLVVITGRTSDEAQARFEQLQGYLHPAVSLNTLSFKMGFVDLSGLSLDEPLPASAAPPGYQQRDMKAGFWRYYELGEREGLTLRELAAAASGSIAGLQIVGSYTEIADIMEEWFRAGAADGFNIEPAYLPGMFNEFVELVMPELRKRGLVKESYTGTTLRDHMGLPRPAWGERSVFGQRAATS